jgi:SIR2-like domain
MPSVSLSEDDWDNLLQRIDDKECTPFIGAGASAGTVPLASELAERWARQYKFPLKESKNLGHVAQFLAITRDGMFPKRLFRGLLRETPSPDFSERREPHSALADLKLPIYLTTNYDSFMFQALKSRELNPSWKVCPWNELIRERSAAILDAEPNPADPLVYHLHGHYEIPQSMVLTEDDYLEFLVRLNRDASEPLLPSVIRTALAEHSLLFVGYSLSDWSFRVLFRGVIGSLGATLGSTSIAVQLDPLTRDPPAEWLNQAQQYLQDYFRQIQKLKVLVYWGDARKFACELSERWNAFGGNGR